MSIRLPTVAPFGSFETNHFQRSGGEIEDGGGGRPVKPSASLARIDDHRLVADASLLLVRAAVYDDRVRRQGSLLDIANVVDDENSRLAELHAVRGLVELEPHPL